MDAWDHLLAHRDELQAENDQLREANAALRGALERIENHAHDDYREHDIPEALWYSTIARAALDIYTKEES